MKNLSKNHPVLSKLIISRILPIFLLASINLSSLQINSMEKAAPKTKEQWLEMADAKIHTTATNFLAPYELTLENFEALKADHVLTTEVLAKYHANLEAELAHCKSGGPDTTSAEDNAVLQAIVDEVLIGTNCTNVVIINDPKTQSDGLTLAVGCDYRTNTCYIIMHKNNWLRRTRSRDKVLDYLRAILLHERSHILFHDTLNNQMLALLVFNKLTLIDKIALVSDNELIEKLQAERHMQEFRADIYATVHAPDHGATLIEFLRLCNDEESPWHPAATERIKLLTDVKHDLDTIYGGI